MQPPPVPAGIGALKPKERFGQIKNAPRKNVSIDMVSFEALMTQTKNGLDSLAQLRDVIKKFAKHQSQDAQKLFDIFGKYKPNYVQIGMFDFYFFQTKTNKTHNTQNINKDGMTQFAAVCETFHMLLYETVVTQKNLADYMNNSIVCCVFFVFFCLCVFGLSTKKKHFTKKKCMEILASSHFNVHRR